MKLILTFIESDGCTYCINHILPIEYESEESLICDFESALNTAISNKEYSFKFCSEKFNVNDFYFTEYLSSENKKEKLLPDVCSLDDWFYKNKLSPTRS